MQIEMARLASQYFRQQKELKETEQALGMLLGHVGMHEPRRNMGNCLGVAADNLKKGSKARDELIKASECLSKTVSSFLSTAVNDMQVRTQWPLP